MILPPDQLDTSSLGEFRTVNSPSRPLGEMVTGEKEAVRDRVPRAREEEVGGQDP
jgi:hypothetical protein